MLITTTLGCFSFRSLVPGGEPGGEPGRQASASLESVSVEVLSRNQVVAVKAAAVRHSSALSQWVLVLWCLGSTPSTLRTCLYRGGRGCGLRNSRLLGDDMEEDVGVR